MRISEPVVYNGPPFPNPPSGNSYDHLKKRHFPPRPAQTARRIHADLDDASGGALSARIQSHARESGSFLDLCKNTELATEVTIQPLERFDLDAAILFSDILTVPDAMGLGLYFAEGEGPKFERA